MAKRAACILSFFLVVIACLENSACSGTPTSFFSVILNATALQVGPNQVVKIRAAVPTDKTNAGVTWAFSSTAVAPQAPGTFGPTTTTSASYTSPASVTGKFTVTIKATSIANNALTNSITITIVPPPSLKITTTKLPNGVEFVPYPANTQLQATGGVPPYTWSIVAGSLPTGFKALAANGTISGTATATGTFNFTVQVSDSEATPMKKQAALQIIVTNLLNGSYAFKFSGFNANGTVVVAGSFTSDGISAISGGVEDFNTIAGTPAGGTLESFTGSYTITADNRGTLTFNTSKSGKLIYAFSIDATGVNGRLIEFDSSGIRGSGELAQQNVTTCAFNTLSGANGTGFAVELFGTAGNFAGITPGDVAFAGRFTAETPANSSTPGVVDNGEIDANVPNNGLANPLTLSGTFQTTNEAGRCTMSLSFQLANMTFSVYPVSVSGGLVTQAYIVETDAAGTANPYVTVGRMIQQVGYPFTQPSNSFAATSVAGLFGAAIPSGGVNYVAVAGLAELTPAGGGAFTMPVVLNVGGSVGSSLGANAISANLNPGDSFGRVTTNLAGGFVPAFYVINTNEALFILENPNAAVLGILEPQSAGPFSATAFTGAFVEGTAPPGVAAAQDFSGTMTLANTNATSGTFAGTQDTSTSLANTPAQAVSGPYSITDTVAGVGTIGPLTAPLPVAPLGAFTAQFFIVSSTKLAAITTTPNDTNPVLFFVGE